MMVLQSTSKQKWSTGLSSQEMRQRGSERSLNGDKVPADDTTDSCRVSLPHRSCPEPSAIRGSPVLFRLWSPHLLTEIQVRLLHSLLASKSTFSVKVGE